MIKKTLASNVRKFRLKAKMTQKQLAEKVGTTPQIIQNYERERSVMSAVRLYKMAKIVKTKIDYFFT